ncbi:MAG: DUF58 domain-containing protein [Halorubrum sp.]
MSTQAIADRLDGAALMAILLVIVGTVFGERSLLLAAAVPLGYLSINWVATPPAVDITVEREVTPNPVAPGEQATVTLTVRNEGETTVTDGRFVDGVPEELPVASGSPRACLSLRPGTSGSFEYTLVARQGTYEFDSLSARFRSLSAVAMRTETLPVRGATTVRCRHDAGDVPQLDGSLRRVGTRPSDLPGEGVQLHSTRAYRLGDPARRINWRRYAKTGTLTTVQFDETNATETIVVIELAANGHVARNPGYPTANELTIYAADRIIARLFAERNDVGLCVLGLPKTDISVPVSTTRSGHPWIQPGSDDSTKMRIDAVFDALSATNDTEGWHSDGQITDLREQIPLHADVILVTPALDDATAELVISLGSADRRFTVISPDVTDRESAGRSVSRISRSLRLAQLRAAGVTVFDWDTRFTLATAMEAGL